MPFSLRRFHKLFAKCFVSIDGWLYLWLMDCESTWYKVFSGWISYLQAPGAYPLASFIFGGMQRWKNAAAFDGQHSFIRRSLNSSATGKSTWYFFQAIPPYLSNPITDLQLARISAHQRFDSSLLMLKLFACGQMLQLGVLRSLNEWGKVWVRSWPNSRAQT